MFSIDNLHLKFQVVYSCTACQVNLWIFTLAFSFHQDFGDVKCCRLTGQLNDNTNQLYSTASGMRRANHQIFRSTNSGNSEIWSAVYRSFQFKASSNIKEHLLVQSHSNVIEANNTLALKGGVALVPRLPLDCKMNFFSQHNRCA